VRRNAAAVPLRDAVLIATVANHPAILASHLEEFSRLQIASAAAHSLRQAILDIFARWESEGRPGTPERMHEELTAGGALARLDDLNRQLRENRIWQALPDAAHEDALEGWLQALALHARAHQLRRDLQSAEMALAQEENEENFDRLVEIRSEYARAEGIEALIEGFGLPSGRPVRRF
jgi:DNA primase